jgi:ABC-2 type transport system permease protein
MISILHESELGTLPRLFTTPTNRTTILGGKFLAVFLTVIIQGLVLITVGRLAFKIEWGQPAAVLLALVGQVLGASGLGVLLISMVKTTKQEGLVMGGALTALGMIGGLFTVGVNMPKSFQTLTLFTPHGWVIQGWKLAMDSAPLSELALPFLILLAAGVVMFLAGALLFRRRFA